MGMKQRHTFKAQASKMPLMIQGTLLHLHTLLWPNQNSMLYQLISEVFLLLQNPSLIPSEGLIIPNTHEELFSGMQGF